LLREQDMKYSYRELNITATTKLDQPGRLMRCEKVNSFCEFKPSAERNFTRAEKMCSWRSF